MDEAAYQARIDEYLAFATTTEPTGNPVVIGAFLIRSRRDPDFAWAIENVTVDSLADSFAAIDGWQPDRDQLMMQLHWLLALGQGDTAMTRLSPDVIEAIDQRLLDNRYRYDDPRPDDRTDGLWFNSESGRIVGAANEYLAGQGLLDATFAVSGLTGAEHMERARPDIVGWVAERAEFGFFDWHSHVEMQRNVAALLMLAELAEDPEIVSAAGMALDLCLVDMAAHHHAGTYTAPRGRTFKKDKMTSLDEDTFGTAKFVFDDTTFPYQSTSDTGVTYLCAAARYRPPQVVVEIATDDRPGVVREHHGVPLDGSAPLTDTPEAPAGKDFDDPVNLAFWWSLGAAGTWQLARTGIDAANDHQLWETAGFADIAPFATALDDDPEQIREWEQENATAANLALLGEANTYAYRDAKVSLASVLDHRFGELRDAGHPLQAAIDERAMVFTQHPVTDVAETTIWADDPAPGYWTGSASMPRIAQVQRTAIAVYEPSWDESLDPLVWSEFEYRPFTHAYFPQDHFDEVHQVANWTIGAKGGGFIALWSWRMPTWRAYDSTVVATAGMTQPFDLVAEGGADNVWIVEVGNDEGGDFDGFVTAVTAIDPSVVRDEAGFIVSWTSPSSGIVDFTSTGRFLVEGVEQPLGDHPRHESPWGGVEHGSRQYNLTAASSTWSCDFDTLTRTVS